MIADAARRWWALVAIAVCVLVVGLDLTVLNLALPTLARDLHASTGDLQWFASAYSLVLAAVLLPAGLLGDRFGRKRVLLIALAVFGASSAACAYATSSSGLIAARAFLGLGAAAILPLSLSILPVFFTAAERPRAIAVIMGATFVGYPVGPLLGGWLLDNYWWGSVFLINVPVVVLAMAAVAVLMPESRASARPRLDAGGVLASSLSLAGLTYGFIKAGQDGWANGAALIALAAGAVLMAGFVAWEQRLTRRPGTQPLVELALFRSAGFTWGSILTTLVSFALFGILFAMPQYFQDVRGLDAFGSGLRLLPMIAGLVAGMLGGTRLQGTRRPVVSARSLVTAGFAIMAIALALGALTRVNSANAAIAAWFTAVGLGLGLALPAGMNAALGALSAERSGSGSALISAMRQVGATIGVAILGTVLGSGYRSHLSLSRLPASGADIARASIAGGIAVARQSHSAALLTAVRTAFTDSMDTMLWVCGGIALAAGVLAVSFLPRGGRESAAGTEQQTAPTRIASLRVSPTLGLMRRGEVWWVQFDERRPVVLLSDEGPAGFSAMQVVPPAGTDLSGLGTEIALGAPEGLPAGGVLRFALARPGFTPCTWQTTLTRQDLIERAGTVPAGKLAEIDAALRASEREAEWTPEAVARFRQMRDALRARHGIGA